MRVAVYYNNRDIRIEERPIPKIGSGEILVKVVASGICGSDVMEWYRIKKAPAVLGHEITGEIVEVGENVRDYRVGDRVFVSHHVPCNTCHYCLNGHHTACETLHKTNYEPGGFAEYIRIPEINVDRGVYLLPDEISFEDGTFIEPLACVVRGQRLLRIQPGESILIIGSGISGLLHINLARITGAGRVIATDINEYRLKASIRFGADTVIYAEEDVPSRLRQVNKNRLADHVIICTGAPSAIAQALQSVDSGGTVLFFAVPEPCINVSIPITDFWRREVTMMTSYGASPSDIAVAIKLISSRKVHVNEMITHRLSLSETGLGFQLVADANESIKVIIEPSR
ncbi:MAG: zinc-dependent dehydrogenase [Nitrospirota bacterium]